MKDITKPQIAGIHTALRVRKMHEQKNSLVYQYTNGRTESVAAMTFTEAHELLKMLNNQKTEKKEPREKMIRSIIAMAREMGVITRKQVVTENGLEWKSDYSQFNHWLLTKSSAKKKTLNLCSYGELNTLVTQYKAIYQSWLKKLH
ncbi:MAG: hypothetical protein ACT4OJ_04885 [Bacteroidota bacterium]